MRRKRVIEFLRKLFPNEQWKYDHQSHRWIGTTFEVYGESYGYDETTGYHTVQYRRNDTYELLTSIPSRLEYCG